MGSTGSTMRGLALTSVRKLEVVDLAMPPLRPREVRVRIGAVGLCGTDFHIFEGHANYSSDENGRPIPFEIQPQVLGHEFAGVIVETGSEVRDLRVGERVVVDQGINCYSREVPPCEYCLTGSSHQCAGYAEHGITGLQGALAEYLAIPAVNVVRIESDLPIDQAALTEPLGCIVHSCDLLRRTAARYTFGGERPIRSVLICGAGPAGLLFTQYLRQVVGYDGLLLLTEPNARRRALAEGYGATVIDPASTDLVAAIREHTHGEMLNCLIESAGIGKIFVEMPSLIRKQATIVLYGHGHHGVDLGVLNRLQFIEPTFIAPTGASGSLGEDHRPATYREALKWLSEKRIDVSRFITNRYHSLEDVPRGFTAERFSADYIKGVAVFE
ncbi:MAG: zinc-dependent alcohol dehydrogenase [Blastocatellia bacterium]